MYLKAILKSIFDFLKKFRKPKQKTSTTIFIHEIHVDKIEANVNLRKLKGDRQAEALRRQFRNEIKEIRKTALVNHYLKFPLKVLAFLCRL